MCQFSQFVSYSLSGSESLRRKSILKLLWNLITDRPSDSHPVCPRRGTYLFPASDCIKFVLFLTLLGGEKNAWLMHGTHWWLQGAKSTLFMFGRQWARSVLLGTDSVLWSLAPLCKPSCPPDIHYSSSQPGLCNILCMCAFDYSR